MGKATFDLTRAGFLAPHLLASAALFAGPALAGTFNYIAITPKALFAQAGGLNEQDEVVGNISLDLNTQVGFYWHDGVLTEVSPPGGSGTTLFCINNKGLAAGYSFTYPKRTLFTYDGRTGALQVIKLVPFFLVPTGINANGRIAGDFSYLKSPPPQAGFVTKGSALRVLKYAASMNTYLEISGINDRGDVVGSEYGPNPSGFVFKNGVYTPFAGPGPSATPSFIMNDGTIGGSYRQGSVTAGFVASGGKVSTYVYPGSSFTNVLGLGPAGSVLGATTCEQGHACGFVYTNGNYYPVKYPGAENTYISGVNAEGSMAGTFSTEIQDGRVFIAKCLPGQGPCTP